MAGVVELELSDQVTERVSLEVSDTEGVGLTLRRVVSEQFETDDGGFTHGEWLVDPWRYWSAR